MEKENPDKDPFGNLPEIMRSLADAFEGKKDINEKDPYGIDNAILIVKKKLNAQVHTISNDDISNSQKNLELSDIWLDEKISLSRSNSNYIVQTPLEWFNSNIENLKSLLLVNAKSTEMGFQRTLKNLSQINNDDSNNDFENKNNTQSILIGPFGAIGSKEFSGALYKNTFRKTVQGLFWNLSQNVFSTTDSGFLFSDAPGIIMPNVKSVFSNSNNFLLFISLLELTRFRLLKNYPWINKQLIKFVKELGESANLNKDDIPQMLQAFDPHDPMSTNLDPENANQNMMEDLNETVENSKKKSEFYDFTHLILLIESWVKYISLSVSINKIPEVQSINDAISNRKHNSINMIVSFITQISWNINNGLNAYTNFWEYVYKNLTNNEVNQLWTHPDFLPTINNIDHPEKFTENTKKSLENDFNQLLNDNSKDDND